MIQHSVSTGQAAIRAGKPLRFLRVVNRLVGRFRRFSKVMDRVGSGRVGSLRTTATRRAHPHCHTCRDETASASDYA